MPRAIRRAGERFAGALDEVTERNRRRAGGFTARGTARRSPSCRGTHRRTARRRARPPASPRCATAATALEPGHPVRRAVREAQAAADARDQLVLVDGEEPGTRATTVAAARPSQPRSPLSAAVEGRRPGDHLPSGSKAARTRCGEPRVRQRRPETVETGRARLAEQPTAGAGRRHPRCVRAPLRRRRRRGRCRPRPRPASGRRPRRAPGPAPAAPTDAPRSGRGGHRRARAADQPRVDDPSIAARSASTSAATPSSSTCVRVPSHAMHDGR